MNTLHEPTTGTKRSSSQITNLAPIAEKSHVESLNLHNDYWHEWAANRSAELPIAQRKLAKQRWTRIGVRVLALGVFAVILGVVFNSLNTIH